MAGTSLNDLLYEFLKKITSATSGSTEDMAIIALLSSIDPTFTLSGVTEAIAYEELTANKTISFADADILYFYVNPAGASIQFTMPSDPGSLSKSGILWVKNNTGKAHTWNTSPAIRFVSETDADTVPTPAVDGYYTRYTCQWNDNNGGTGFWAVGLAGKDTA